jgi:hypothetical protein
LLVSIGSAKLGAEIKDSSPDEELILKKSLSTPLSTLYITF